MASWRQEFQVLSDEEIAARISFVQSGNAADFASYVSARARTDLFLKSFAASLPVDGTPAHS